MAQALTGKTAKTAALPARPSIVNARTGWLVVLFFAVACSLARAGLFSGEELVNSGGWGQFSAFWQAAFNPVLTPEFLTLALQATLATLAYAASGTFLSVLVGSLLGLLATELWWESVWPKRTVLRRGPWLLMRALLAVPRGIHELLWALFFLNIFGLDPLVAILAIGIPYSAIVAKLFSEIIDESQRAPYRALLNSGVTPLNAFLYALLPAALPDLLSYTFYRFECAIRTAAVLGVVGAGGLGYQILLSMQTLDYNETWTLFYALLLLSGLADYWSATVRHSLGRTDCVCAGGKFPSGRHGLPPNNTTLYRSLALATALVVLSFAYLRPSWHLLWSPRTWTLFRGIAQRAPSPGRMWSDAGLLVELSQDTLAMSILAASLAAIGGMLLSFPAARNILQPGGILDGGGNGHVRRAWSTLFLATTRYALLVMRAIPAPIWALVLLFILFPGVFPGALALGIYNLGVLGRLMAEVTENQDERPARALQAQGITGWKSFLYAMLPATMPRYVAYGLYRWEIAIRATVIVGLVGAGGLGRLLTQQLSAFDYGGVMVTLVFFIGLTFLVDLTSMLVRRSFRS